MHSLACLSFLTTLLSLLSFVVALPHPERRFSFTKRSRFTFYAAGLGACGGYNSDSDYIVALNRPQWDGGAHCGQQITITANGQTASATIVDMCEGCGPGELDFTPSLFEHFGPLSLGVLDGSWSFGGAPTPTPTPAHEPTPTTPSSQQQQTSSTSTSSSASQTQTTSTGSGGVLAQMNLAMDDLRGFLTQAAAVPS